MPRFEVALTVTVHDAEVQDVRTLLDQFRAAMGSQVAIEAVDGATQKHVRALRPAGTVPSLKRAYRGWLTRRHEVLKTLEETRGDIAESARRLNVSQQTMYDWSKRLGYQPPALSA